MTEDMQMVKGFFAAMKICQGLLLGVECHEIEFVNLFHHKSQGRLATFYFRLPAGQRITPI